MDRRLFLIFHGRFPSEKAASLFAAKSAESFSKEGMQVDILVPRRKGVNAQDAYEYFGVGRTFNIVELPTIDLFGGPFRAFAFWASFIAFSISSYLYLKRNAAPADIVYSNESLPLYAASFASKNTFYEMHDFPESKLSLFSRLLASAKWILVHNRWKIQKIRELFPGINLSKILYEPNAVDIDAFDQKISAKEARDRVDLPQDKKIAVYTGHLYGWKGADTLASAAKLLPEDFLAVFVGGTEKDIKSFQERFGDSKKIMIVGHRKHAEIPFWQKSADVLVLPNSGKEAISLYYTSPMKLFEYMASRRPIIASNIPSIAEIIDEESAILVSPDDPTALAHAIEHIVRAEKIGETLSAKAFEKVSEHTWKRRAERIIDFMKDHA
jgi:glycosyltransferase involved in cell wall biosynthesis